MSAALGWRIVRASSLLIACLGAALPASAATVSLGNATATICQTTGGYWPIGNAIDGSFASDNGWAVYGGIGNSQVAVFKSATTITNGAGTNLTFRLNMLYGGGYHLLGKFRLSATSSDRGTYGQGADACNDANPGGSAAWTVLVPQSVVSANGQTLTVQPDGSVLASGDTPATDVVTFQLVTPQQGITGFRLEALADASLPSNGPGRAENGNFVLTELVVDQVGLSMVPALSEWALALTSLLLGAAGLLWLRRRRA